MKCNPSCIVRLGLTIIRLFEGMVMKRIISVIIICVLVLVGCGKSDVTKLELKPDSFASDKINFNKPQLDEYISRYGYDSAVDNFINNTLECSSTIVTSAIEVKPIDTIYGSFIRFDSIYSHGQDPVTVLVNKDGSCNVYVPNNFLLECDCTKLINKDGTYFVDSNTIATQEQIDTYESAMKLDIHRLDINEYQFMPYQQFKIDDITRVTKGGSYILTREYCGHSNYSGNGNELLYNNIDYDNTKFAVEPGYECSNDDIITAFGIGTTLFERHMLFKESTDSIDIIGYVYIQV